MTGYFAVVRYPVDASIKEKRRVLIEGLGYICMELIAEHKISLEDLEDALQNAQGEAELEIDMAQQRGDYPKEES